MRADATSRASPVAAPQAAKVRRAIGCMAGAGADSCWEKSVRHTNRAKIIPSIHSKAETRCFR